MSFLISIITAGDQAQLINSSGHSFNKYNLFVISWLADD